MTSIYSHLLILFFFILISNILEFHIYQKAFEIIKYDISFLK